jgi:hypothetical protein
MKTITPVLFLSAIACVAPAAELEVSDSTAAFLKFWDAAKSAPAPERIRPFREVVYASNPDFYQYRFEDWKKSGLNPDQELARQLDLYASYEAVFRDIQGTIRNQLESSLASFSARFPDFVSTTPIYVVHSLGLADGTKRSIAGRDVFVVGVDVIARHHPTGNAAFFHHELLHLYHGQHYRQSAALLSHLWGEGLAVYVSQALNPSATSKELLLADDRGSLSERVDPILPRLAAELLADADSQDWKIHNKYFAASSRDPATPARCGYHIGYLLARKLSAQYSLEQLIRLQDDALFPALRAALGQMSRLPE